MGSDANWALATDALKQALERMHMAYSIDPGEGVFYGPKIDIKIKDQLNRSWQCSTIQVDFNLPERFAINYTGEDGVEGSQRLRVRAALPLSSTAVLYIASVKQPNKSRWHSSIPTVQL